MRTPPMHVVTRRSPFGAAAAAALTLILTACAGSGATSADTSPAPSTIVVTAAPTTTPTTAPARATTAAPAATSTTVALAGPPAPPTTAAPDPKALLADAVASLRNGYDVDTNVTAGGQNTNIAGRIVGTNSSFTLTRGDATVEYLRVPPQTWVRDPGEEWKEATDDAAPRDALTPFASPVNVVVTAVAADGTHLKATYDGASFGAEAPVDAEMVLEPDGGITISYTAITQGTPLAVITRVAPTKDATPIAAP